MFKNRFKGFAKEKFTDDYVEMTPEEEEAFLKFGADAFQIIKGETEEEDRCELIPDYFDTYFARLKGSKCNEINQARIHAREIEGAEYNNDLFDIDETSQSNILAQIKVAELLNNAKATYTYRSKTNQNHSFTVTQLQELGLVIAQKVNEIYQKSWDLKTQVDNAKTEDELNKITW